MRRLAPLLVLLAALAGCDRGTSASSGSVKAGNTGTTGAGANGLTLSVAFDEPLQSGQTVGWRLEVGNRSGSAVTLRFRSGKQGDVVLAQGGRELYRWSANRLFSQAIREIPLAAGSSTTLALEPDQLHVPPGDYDLVAEADSEPAPGVVHRSVTVR
ncbi:MAG TPA: BsuPI-related putative proteinase inhibitor [Acidimicrobiia bacterium]|nr:BsuPI-related putative proteinase inhibitor [Acidimicrobiia bacterium]